MHISYPRLISILRAWLPYAAVITLMCGTIYITVQQNFRQNANDPQIQIAENAAYAIAMGADPHYLPDSQVIDMAESISPFIIIYDHDLHPIASDATLHGTIPTPPAGVFAYAKSHGENRLTWQPERSVRNATVVVPYTFNDQSGFVLAGRSLRETERRVEALTLNLTIAWFCSMLFTLVLIGFLEYTRV